MTDEERNAAALEAISNASFTWVKDLHAEAEMLAADQVYEEELVEEFLQQMDNEPLFMCQLPDSVEDLVWSKPGGSSSRCAGLIADLREAFWNLLLDQQERE